MSGHVTLAGCATMCLLVALPAYAGSVTSDHPQGYILAAATQEAGLVFTLERRPESDHVALIKVKNPSHQSWCLDDVPFAMGRFLIKIGDRVIKSRANKMVPAGLPCQSFKPGEAHEEKLDLQGAFLPNELQKGQLCYTFSYRSDPMPQQPGHRKFVELSTVCEGHGSSGYLMPTE